MSKDFESIVGPSQQLVYEHDRGCSPWSCWLITNDREAFEAARQQAEFVGLPSGVVGGSGRFYYFVGREPGDSLDGVRYGELCRAVEAKANDLNRKWIEGYEQLSAAEKQKLAQENADNERRRRAANFTRARGAARWTWPSDEFSRLYDHTCLLVVDQLQRDWADQFFEGLLLEIEMGEDLATKFASIDEAARKLHAQADLIGPLVWQMQRQLRGDPKANGRKQVLLELQQFVWEIRQAASNAKRVFMLRNRTIPTNVKKAVRDRDGKRCVVCDAKQRLEFDHILPFREGGWHATENLRLLCKTCHRVKSIIEYERGVSWEIPQVLTLRDAFIRDEPAFQELKLRRSPSSTIRPIAGTPSQLALKSSTSIF